MAKPRQGVRHSFDVDLGLYFCLLRFAFCLLTCSSLPQEQPKRQNAKVKAIKGTTMIDKRRDLGERLLEYGARIIKLVESLPNTVVGRRVADQLLRSGTSAGANYEEARGAESKDDFVHKLQIALKELRESNYWLRLLVKSGKISAERMNDLLDESNQLRAILSKSVATAKGKAKVSVHEEA
jgi:four helix bundle protein